MSVRHHRAVHLLLPGTLQSVSKHAGLCISSRQSAFIRSQPFESDVSAATRVGVAGLPSALSMFGMQACSKACQFCKNAFPVISTTTTTALARHHIDGTNNC